MNRNQFKFIAVSIVCLSFLFTCLCGFESVQIPSVDGESNVAFALLCSELGIEEVKAAQVVDAIDAGSTAISVASIVMACSGAGLVAAGGWFALKAMIKKCGKRAAVAY